MNGYVGLDLSKKTMEAVRLGPQEKPERIKFGTTKESILKLTNWLRTDDLIAIEVGTYAFFLARLLRTAGFQCIVLNPRRLAMIYQSYKKTDKEDALKLARLIQRIPVEELPTVVVPTEEEESHRQIVRERQNWTTLRTKMINRIHAIFVLAGITEVKKSGLGTKAARTHWIEKIPIQFLDQINRLCDAVELYESMIAEIDTQINEILRENIEFTKLALSIPGVGKTTAFVFLAYLGDCRRFGSAAKMASYAGLTPRVDSSGDTVRYGRIKNGCGPIRKIILQSAWSLIRSNDSGPLKKFYMRLYTRLGKKKAAVATARKIIETFYTLMTKKEVYWGSHGLLLNRKFKAIGLIV